MNNKKYKNPYANKYIALLRKPVNICSDFCGIIQEYIETEFVKCGLYTFNVRIDDIYNTLYITLNPHKANKYCFKDITYQIYEFDKKPTTNIIELDPNKEFDYQELFKAEGFVDFINKCLNIKETVEYEPDKYYFIYNKLVFKFIENKWYKDNEEIPECELFEFFYKIPWEYNSDKIKLKKYNIFNRLKNYGRQ